MIKLKEIIVIGHYTNLLYINNNTRGVITNKSPSTSTKYTPYWESSSLQISCALRIALRFIYVHFASLHLWDATLIN